LKLTSRKMREKKWGCVNERLGERKKPEGETATLRGDVEKGVRLEKIRKSSLLIG